jgi:Planctomycete cytochrome C
MRNPKLLSVGVVVGGVAVATMFLTPIHNACAQRAQMSFAEDVTPIFKGWCVSCHQPGGQGYEASGLDLTSYDTLMKGTKFGPMVIPGKPDESNLFVLIEGRAKVTMPFGHKRLPSCLREDIYSWIFQGAKNN